MATKLRSVVDKARVTFPKVRTTGGVSIDEISAFQKGLNVALPDDYRFFLSEYGTLGFYGLEIYGIVSGEMDAPGIPNNFAATREGYESRTIPPGSIIISYTGYGPAYILKTDYSHGCEPGVYFWDYSGSFDSSKREFSTFEDFAITMIETYLDDYAAAKST